MTGKFKGKLEKIGDYKWRIPKSYASGMRVPGLIYADDELIKAIVNDNAAEQVANCAHMPGIVGQAMAMPDIHWGYGSPIGGVIATDVEAGGIISPGIVGYDVNCGIRLLRTNLTEKEVRPRLKELVDELYKKVPTGVGSSGKIKLTRKDEEDIFRNGAGWAVKKGYGFEEDLELCEEGGAIGGADPSKVSQRAYERGNDQAGTLGSGNHFLEVQIVDEIYRSDIAKVLGIDMGQITIMIHTGSRGVGHQVCTDYTAYMLKIMGKYGINVPDRQLSCAPLKSKEGQDYLGAMRSAANFAWCNRQIISHLAREAFQNIFHKKPREMGMFLVYDVAHNIAKIEKYTIDGNERNLCVHRKGATRAFPPGHKEIPAKYKEIGQPVLIPGDMGRYSFILVGTEKASETFYTTCHGAGRAMSRHGAKDVTRGRDIRRELEDKGIIVRYTGRTTLNEEFPEAYKDVANVVDVVQKAGISEKVAMMRPIGVIKG